MLENLFFKEEKETNYPFLFLISFSISIIAFVLSKYVLKFYQGLLTVFIISLGLAYPLIKFLKEEIDEEEYIAKKKKETFLLKRHEKEVGIYLSVFLGVMFAFSLSFYFLPKGFFASQLTTIEKMLGISIITGKAAGGLSFNEILVNNLRIFSLTFLLSFFISAGMIFILVWNASVLGVFLGYKSSSMFEIPIYTFSYLPHGLIEIAAYILAGISGLILSTQFEKIKKEDSETTFNIVKDVGSLMAIGIGLVFLGALIEVI